MLFDAKLRFDPSTFTKIGFLFWNMILSPSQFEIIIVCL
jgi:hypothetical protein